MNFETFKNFLVENKRWVGVILGLIVGILILTINFWRTLVLLICAFIGWWLSGTTDIREKIYRLVEKIFSHR